MATLEQAYQMAVDRYQSGDHGQAQQVCRQILSQVPDQPDTLHLMGVIEHVAGRNDQAEQLIEKAVALDASNAAFRLNLGLVNKALGKIENAIDQYRRAVELDGEFAEALCNLGNALWEQGEMAESAQVSRRALELRPDLSQAYNNLANALKGLGRGEEAVVLYEQALAKQPKDTEVLRNLGNLLRSRGQYADAIDKLSAAVALSPQVAQSHICLGQAQLEAGQLGEAQSSFEAAVQLEPAGAEGLIALGNALKDSGEAEQAAGLYRRALQVEPHNAMAHDNLLFTMGYLPDADPTEVLAMHVTWGRQVIGSLPRPLQHINDNGPDRRLRVGYVSPDFCTHAVACFLLPLIAEHDEREVELFCYAQVENADSTTAQFQAYAKHWRNTCGVNDDKMAQMIRDDRIDLLVDLAGHSQNNRLGVFARKPAPVQLTYLGYGHTTGLETVDYRLTDPVVDPQGEPPRYVEKLAHLDECFLCYAPPRYATDVQPLPALANGHVTFGSLTNPAKLNDVVFDLWAQVLTEVPDARLLLARDSFRGAMRQKLIDKFAQRGIDEARLTIESELAPGTRRIQLYDRIDIALDTTPYSGATTTCEAMWMGVPTIALYGPTYVSRMSATVLQRAGLTGWVADAPQQYAAIAARLAGDLEELALLRGQLRERVAASPLCDAPRFARGVEQAYRRMWRQWCQRDDINS